MKIKGIKKYSVLILFAGLLIGSSSAQQSNNVEYSVSPQSKLFIDCTSTLHNFKVNATKINGSVSIVSNSDQNTNGVKISELKVIIPVKNLDTDKKSMNSNMDKSLKAEKNPDISYALNSVDTFKLSEDPSKPDTIKTTGTLNIAGVTKNIQMDVAGYRSADGTLHFSGEKKINMVDYGIDPPTMFFGTIRVGKDVNVHFDLVLTAQTQLIGSK